MSLKICQKCSKENKATAKFCYFCGTKLPLENETLVSSNVDANQTSNEIPLKIQNEEIAVRNENVKTQAGNSDFIGLSDIRTKLEVFINTQKVRNRQKSIGMNINEENPVLIFKGETGSGKSLVAESFIKMLGVSSQKVERTTARKLQRFYQTDVEISNYISSKNLEVLLVHEIQNDRNYLKELLLGLTDKKTQTISILLGTKEPIENFFKEYPKLVDLVSIYDFPNISDEDLTIILQKKIENNGLIYDEKVKSNFPLSISEAKNDTSNIYKNGWIVEKYVFRKILEKQAVRLSQMQNLKDEDYKYILFEDLPISKKAESVDEVLLQLDELIGMESVKNKVKELCLSVQNNIKRKELGLVSENPKIHIVLTGNPGTGKTTVARLLGKLFFAMRLLPSEKVIETDGLGLTAGYVGQTKDKVNDFCDKAMGGVLFIDEAYYLSGESNSYGNEAVGTLLKRMEDDRGKFIVIVAGYQTEMSDFLKMNPGLDSRFTHKINIEDYTRDELFEILKLKLKKVNFVFDADSNEFARKAVEERCKNKSKTFANAREIRNLFDKMKFNLDTRISKLPIENLTKDILSTITKADIPYTQKTKVSVENVFAELNELIGMENVKDAIRELYDTIKINKELEKVGKNLKSLKFTLY